MNIMKPFTKKKKSQTAINANNSSADYGSNQRSCLNSEELMQFEVARQRALSQLPPERHPKPFSEFVPFRIFVNNVDTFNGSHYVKFLSEIKKELEDEEEQVGGSGGEDAETDNLNVDDENDGPIDEKEIEDDNSHYSEDNDLSYKRKFRGFYEIIGTLNFIDNPQYNRPEGILDLLDNEKKSEFLEMVLSCGYIVYDITSDLSCHPKQIQEAKWIVDSICKRLEELEKTQPKAFSKYNACRTFILVSTLMTWAKTKPLNPDDVTLPFTERDFRKRKPHPNYKIHCDLEKLIIESGKKYPKHLKTIVIGSGIPYGEEEDILHFYFKTAWQGAPYLPIFGSGKNIIPVIHINSLSSIIHNIIENFPQKYTYIIATDPHSITQAEIVKLLAKKLGSGKTMIVNKEEAFLYPDIKQRIYDMLTTNVNIIPGFIMDNPTINWATDRPFKENIDKLIEEFKLSRGLLPIKIFIHGPPASGKSLLAKRLSAYYDVPHLHVKEVINEAIQSLKDRIQCLEKKASKADGKGRTKVEGNLDEDYHNDNVEDDDDQDEDMEEEEEQDLETLKESLREIEQNMDEKSRLDENYVIRFFKEKMLSNACQNKGYVVDGYPKTIDYTQMLYGPTEDDEQQATAFESGQESVSHLCNMKIMPAYVESLDASDEFLIERVIKMPERCIQNTHYEEPEMCRRLAEFRSLNTDDNSPLIFYDELDVHPMIHDVELDLNSQMDSTFQAIINHVGPPRNYGKDSAVLDEILKGEQRRLSQQEEIEKMKARKEEIRKAAQERRENAERWMLLKNKELEMEERALLVMGMPLRHYLMKYIFPTLTRGLVEVARLRPDDPVDFLSEFLFRENPEGKMFQPNFEEREEKLEEAIKEYEKSLLSKRTSYRKSSSKTFSGDKSVRSDIISRVTSYKCSVSSSASKKSKYTNASIGRARAASKSASSEICTCKKSTSLSTCSSDVTTSTPASCTCTVSDEDRQCEPCDDLDDVDPCKCPC